MRSPVFDRILKEMENDPWHVKLKRWIRVEIHCIKCLGFGRYLKLNIKRLLKKIPMINKIKF
jgi:hypothetical protein